MAAETELMTRAEVAALLRLSAKTLGNWASTGKNALPYTKVGGRDRYRRSDVEKWLQERRRA